MGENSFEAFVVGALDSIGFSEELSSRFSEGEEYKMDLVVHNKTLKIAPKK